MDNLTNLFCFVDDFCQEIEPWLKNQLLENGVKQRRNRGSKLSLSEIMTLTINFHQSNYRDFKHYYLWHVEKNLRHLFPNLVSYNRFVELMAEALLPLTLLIYSIKKEHTGIYFVDSTPIEVCHIKRMHSNKVFSGLAKKSKTTKGWFFGFKLHIVANDKGDLMSFKITKSNTDDRKPVLDLMKGLEGKLFGDKGYISAELFNTLLAKGIKLITKIKKNMQNKLMDLTDKILLRKRAIVETIIDQLKNISQIEHSRHRSATNFLVNMVAGLTAYCFREKKPSLKLDKDLCIA